ncbi:MAG: excinuclease ABC subunit C [Bacteroidales bacterium]|nr:excinuclease ABC subunit C [Bacteroidales bacterium]
MNVREKVSLLPHSPGVYRFFNGDGEVIYVGKAKDLHRRVSQYFRPPESLDRKTRVMVSKIADMMFAVVESEEDALLLENNLIKKLQPRYNILLKDSKTYPWIVIKKEPFPRVMLTRRLVKDGSRFFGPYSSATYAHSMLDLIASLYPLRNCKLRLSEEGIAAGKFKVCLNAHLGRCCAPCVGTTSKAAYDEMIAQIETLLGGGVRGLIRENKEKMAAAAAELRFEDAQVYKERVALLEKHYSKSAIVNQTMNDTDIFSIVSEGEEHFCNFMRIREGCVVQSFNMELEAKIEESPEEVLAAFIAEMISKFGALSKEVVVPFAPAAEFDGVDIVVPQRGAKLELLKLSQKNAGALKVEKYRHEEKVNPEEYNEKVMLALQRDLGMRDLPQHIECFDNSNIQGTNPVASCVVFKNARPSKKDYRHFNIKTVVGANDYASMKEVVNRRYSRLLAEGEPLPQLIVIDGGKGQLHFALEALRELGLADQLCVIGLAKRLEEVIRPGDPYPLFLDKNSSSLKVLMQIRDEAHRFGITHHRARRSKSQIGSQLAEIKGVGDVTAAKLLRHFKSVAKVKKATLEELEQVVGKSAAARVRNHFDNEAQ